MPEYRIAITRLYIIYRISQIHENFAFEVDSMIISPLCTRNRYRMRMAAA